MWCQFGRWKLLLTSNLKWPEREKSLYSTLKKKIIQITSSHSRRSPKHWYYWKIVKEFCLKCTKFKHVDQLVTDTDSSSTLVKGGHLWLKLSKMLYSGMYCLFIYLSSAPQSFSHRDHLSFCPLEPPSWISHGEPPDEIGRLLRVRNLCLLYLWFKQCGCGLSCKPGVHRCYHVPRRFKEPCSFGYSCRHGLYCQPGAHRCVH